MNLCQFYKSVRSLISFSITLFISFIAFKDSDEIFIPDFDGQSYLEFPTLSNVRQAFNIEMWFLTRSLDGTLLYNGQQASGKGDFVAITLKNARVDFRYDLGSSVHSVS